MSKPVCPHIVVEGKCVPYSLPTQVEVRVSADAEAFRAALADASRRIGPGGVVA